MLSANPESGGMYFFQRTRAGNAILWSFHPTTDGRVLFSEQITTLAGFKPDDFFIWTQAGYCEATEAMADRSASSGPSRSPRTRPAGEIAEAKW
ncbi:MAG TPA: hypothetical protein VF550_16840 [Polyangia bacterium]